MPRPLSMSPNRKFSSTLASRLKEKDAIKYEAKPKKIRPISCPPTPTFRFSFNVFSVLINLIVLNRPKIKPTRDVQKPRQKSPSVPKVSIIEPPKQMKTKPAFNKKTIPPPIRRTPTISPEPPVDYDFPKTSSSDGSGDSSGKSRRKIRRTRPESLSSYSSTKTVVHHYPGCEIM